MSGGYEKYLAKTMRRFAAHPDIEAIHLVIQRSLSDRVLPSLAVDAEPKVTIAAVDRFYRPFTRFPSRQLDVELARSHPDVLFIPNFRLLLTARWPQLLMVRNMEPLVWDDRTDPLRQRVVNRARRYEGRLATLRARRLIAVSGFVRQFLIERWDVPEAKVGVVYHGTDAIPPVAASRPDVIPEALRGRFLFTAGAIRPSRGIEDLLGALRLMDPTDRPAVVVAGRADAIFRNFESALRAGAADLPVTWTGNLNEAQMAWCYRSCSAMVMTSRVEACPNVGLEALTYGCIIVAANNPPLPEIFDRAAFYYRPGSAEDLAARLRDIASWNSARRDAAERSAAQRSLEFNWDRTVERTVGELRLTAARP